MAEHITFPVSGGTAPGYLAYPDGSGRAPGVVVIQEWWGMNENIQDITRRFAGAGYVALAPDLYHGRVTTEPDEARKAAMALNFGQALREISGAVAYLKGLSQVSTAKIGVVGFCMGGSLALRSGSSVPDVGAVVAFYGGFQPDPETFAHSSTALLSIVGSRDVNVLEGLRKLHEGLKAYSLPHELVVYPDADHAFFNDTRPHIYKRDAADDAWKRTLNWLHRYLA